MLVLISMPGLEAYFARIQKDCLPGVWSKGMALFRSNAVKLDSHGGEEIILRVVVPDRPVSPKVTLWPGDDDSFCDCGDRNEICAHIAASVIALKSGSLTQAASTPATAAPRILYRFSRREGALGFERTVSYAGREHALEGTLVSFVGGISSGRIAMPAIPATREDFAIDAAVTALRGGVPERSIMPRLLSLLSRSSSVSLDGKPIRVSSQATGLRAELTDAPGGGFRLTSEMDPRISEVFSNGAALCGESLAPLQLPKLGPAENEALSRKSGAIFKSQDEIAALVSELLPALEEKLPLAVLTDKLPAPITGTPKAGLRIENESGDRIVVVASVSYPDPVGPGEIRIPNPALETRLVRRLQSELHLNPGQPARFQGNEAIDFVLKLQSADSDWIIQGEGVPRVGISGPLTPVFEALEDGFNLSFQTPSSGASAGEPRHADPARVLQAWRDGSQYVSLLGGGWAPLPRDWLERFGARVSALLEARSHSGPAPDGKLPPYLLPEVAEFAEEQGASIPESLKRLQAGLRSAADGTSNIPASELPSDLRAELRDYQLQGVHWLSFLRDAGMGALLADDMGLGKTLQALCAIRGRTLVVCPTSVLSAWSGQVARFRPGLRLSVYHGATRELDPAADITLTTYALLRIDRELLSPQKWDTLVLDEAQQIKNPSSQVARAAHSLNGGFRIALSGTPVENRLEDLWSQFQFVNPGLLGSRATFQAQFGQTIAGGSPTAAAAASRLRARLKPFLLRRLKSEVARELPPRTETVLHCELSDSERELYDSILAASRSQVLEKLEQSGNVLAALEMLLRLRQACCSPELVPGGTRPDQQARPPSSKLALLRESLTESVSLGHRALVFSQWTSLLDLIEPELQNAGLHFLRLDGSTRDREAVVNAFQSPDGPPVLLISLKAGGIGLTLTAADHVYIMDPWWNPATEDQAADRAHRIGQENPVLIQRLVARDTIEDRVLALQARKKELAGAVLDGSGGALSLTQDDLRALLVD